MRSCQSRGGAGGQRCAPGLLPPELDAGFLGFGSLGNGASLTDSGDQLGSFRLADVRAESDGFGPVVEGNPAGPAALTRALLWLKAEIAHLAHQVGPREPQAENLRPASKSL